MSPGSSPQCYLVGIVRTRLCLQDFLKQSWESQRGRTIGGRKGWIRTSWDWLLPVTIFAAEDVEDGKDLPKVRDEGFSYKGSADNQLLESMERLRQDGRAAGIQCLWNKKQGIE